MWYGNLPVHRLDDLKLRYIIASAEMLFDFSTQILTAAKSTDEKDRGYIKIAKSFLDLIQLAVDELNDHPNHRIKNCLQLFRCENQAAAFDVKLGILFEAIWD
jgi:hypothetical protein